MDCIGRMVMRPSVSGERESTFLLFVLLRKCVRRFAALPSLRGSWLDLRKSLPCDWTYTRRRLCKFCKR